MSCDLELQKPINAMVHQYLNGMSRVVIFGGVKLFSSRKLTVSRLNLQRVNVGDKSQKITNPCISQEFVVVIDKNS